MTVVHVLAEMSRRGCCYGLVTPPENNCTTSKMTLRKRRAIEGYWRELPSQLKRDYGKSDEYAAWEIYQAIERCGLDTRYIEYAYVIFMSAESFVQLPQATGRSHEYFEMRKELANFWFSGDTEFMDRHGFNGPDVGKFPRHPLLEDIGNGFEPSVNGWRGPL